METIINKGSNSIACIVVTYNRLTLLKKCVDSLRRQSYKAFDIIVVNNGSSDGTEEWLKSNTDINYITQENVGGAGGFYTGMKFANEANYEWIWMMDDDGLADDTQLENLLKGAEKTNSSFVNALVCDINKTGNLSFGLQCNGKSIMSINDAQKHPYIQYSISPFNGTLLHRNVIEKIGYVKREMFIWGDEIEYTQRAIKNSITPCTICSAIHYHPSMKTNYTNVIPFYKKRLGIILPSSPQRAKILFRNKGYLYNTYFKSETTIFKIKYLLYFILRFDFKGLIMFCSYFNKGVKDDYSETIQ